MRSTVTAALTLIVGVALSGCVSAQIEEQRQAKAACQAQTFPTYRAKAECYIRADQIGPDYADLRSYRSAAHLAVADKLDRKVITQVEANAEIAKVEAEITQMGATRASASRSTGPITCTTFGAVTTCN